MTLARLAVEPRNGDEGRRGWERRWYQVTVHSGHADQDDRAETRSRRRREGQLFFDLGVSGRAQIYCVSCCDYHAAASTTYQRGSDLGYRTRGAGRRQEKPLY